MKMILALRGKKRIFGTFKLSILINMNGIPQFMRRDYFFHKTLLVKIIVGKLY
jgi:hypothetical protein